MNTEVYLANLVLIIARSVGKINDNSKLQTIILYLSQQHAWSEPQMRRHATTQTLTHIVLVHTLYTGAHTDRVGQVSTPNCITPSKYVTLFNMFSYHHKELIILYKITLYMFGFTMSRLSQSTQYHCSGMLSIDLSLHIPQ